MQREEKQGVGPDKDGVGKKELPNEIHIKDGAVESVSASGARVRPGDRRLWGAVDRFLKIMPITSISPESIQAGKTTKLTVITAGEIGLSGGGTDGTASKGLGDMVKGLFGGRQKQSGGEGTDRVSEQISYKTADIVIIYTFLAKAATPQGRDGQLIGCATFDQNQLAGIVRQLAESPNFLFQLIKTINNGPVTMFNGQDADISYGKSISFVVSQKVKDALGNLQISLPSESKPFSSR